MWLHTFRICAFLYIWMCLHVVGGSASIIFGLDSIQGALLQKKCADSALETREEMADVVLTGTVRSISRDRNQELYSAEVEVKRVMKGKEKLLEVTGRGQIDRRTIAVQGFGNPEICESDVRVSDTRILMLTLEEGGTLRLNSSVFRISLRNLDRVEHSVNGVPYKGPPKITKSPCDINFCPFHGHCIVKDDKAYCECVRSCPVVDQLVCGTDGSTYRNLCHLKKISCEERRRVNQEHAGKCLKANLCKDLACPPLQVCVTDPVTGQPRCGCVQECEDRMSPVCGTDGRQYSNRCMLELQACQSQQNVRVKNEGPCQGPCASKTCFYGSCRIDNRNQAVCDCNLECSRTEIDPVCGTDGRNYENECLLKKYACEKEEFIRKAHDGPCGDGHESCRTKLCGQNQRCVEENGHVLCINNPCKVCQGEPFNPVCGSNGVSYNNMCELEKANCTAGGINIINLSNLGYCAKDGCGSMKGMCEYYGICDRGRKPAQCVCPDPMECLGSDTKICGSDHVTYENECMMKAASCKERRAISVMSAGDCITCKEGCQFFSKCHLGRCECDAWCLLKGPPVCTSDGQKFNNDCEMKKNVCEKRRHLNVIPCEQPACRSNMDCLHHGECRNNMCHCDRVCPNQERKVCTSSGQEYYNECELRRHMCHTQESVPYTVGECMTAGSGSGASGDDYGGSGEEQFSRLLMCDDSLCLHGGLCIPLPDGLHTCSCDFGCIAVRDTVCGSDGRNYGNRCEMQETACKANKSIVEVDPENCNNADLEEEACDGNAALVNLVTGQDYNCSSEACPPNSYCHLQFGKCCKEEKSSAGSCLDTKYGCCPDQITIATDPQYEGCPYNCNCYASGSRALTCDPKTKACDCLPGVGGLKCDMCKPGYWGLNPETRPNYTPGCVNCDCNQFGAARRDCRQDDGACVCKPGVKGHHCDKCEVDDNPVSFDVCGMEVSSVPYPGRTCKNMDMVLRCKYEGYCMDTSYGAECRCDRLSCILFREAGYSICGNDGKTYVSRCHMKFESCKQQREITVAYNGPCTGSATSHPSSYTRTRKTTGRRNSDFTQRTTTRTTKRPHVVGGRNILSLNLYDDRHCIANNSECYRGVCLCRIGFITTLDDTDCKKVLETPPDNRTYKNPCSDSPCLNNGQCQLDESLGYRCLCPLEKTGSICHKDAKFTVPSFTGTNSYLQLRRTMKPNNDLMFEIRLKILNEDGIITFASQYPNGTGDFIAVTVVKGYLEFRYDLGSGLALIRSKEQLTRNKYHRVVVNRVGKSGQLQVDNSPVLYGESEGALTSLDLSDFLYLGNVPEEAREAKKRLGIQVGMAGCINSFAAGSTVSPHTYSLGYSSRNQDLVAGLDIWECGSNPCSSLPCQNGGSCFMSDREVFHCVCEPGCTGALCEVMLDPCLRSMCKEGSTCVVTEDGGFECQCPENMEGEFCEYERLKKIAVPQFNGSSLIDLPLGEVGSHSVSIRIWFKSSNPNGVVVYASQYPYGFGDYISLNIIDKHLEFRFNVGTGTVVIRSEEEIELNKWHDVLIQKIDRTGTLQIDNNNNRIYTGMSQGILTELNLSSSMLHIGGFNTTVPSDSQIVTNLTGVIQRIYINGHQYDNLIHAAAASINVKEYEGPPCNINPCLNWGVCVPRLDEADCKCPTKYIGARCEKMADPKNKDLPVAFDGSTFLQYPNEITIQQTAQRVNRYSIWIQTRTSGGLILFQNGRSNILGDYLALAVVGGKVELSYNLGKQTEEDLHIIRSSVAVDDGRWHHVIAVRNERVGSLQVDGENAVVDQSTVGADQLDTNGRLWIGGKTELPLGLPKDYYTGFIGCMKDILIDYRSLHLLENRNGQSTSLIKYCGSS
ncbi:LOW QUALITY PROTEIN: agrin-like [Ostrea edulis]|uniref:LOW QUALITY PROTEIN: agrin-like n=1 Tax=Ostrea edulis TaxID=37623 RepID=UPI0024AEAE20|nr:LOW QUALITY PROTEIN: agrin-like [Ostrea edulis]